ncbi:MAG TPA: hypothetical protein DET40_19890 [Lentisphaeria bacterium]|nr:MAG: hypothetical protein A2X45_00880 [Lentisphaerae bacterium GWF2_50_93]HCE45812.1 hypothetical protein [Lentisphaeria bacterium]
MIFKKTVLLAYLVSIGGFFSCTTGAQAPAAPEKAAGWEQCGWGGGAFYYATAWHPTDEKVIYLGGDCAGAYRSDDKGLNWRFTNNGICNYAVYGMAVSPASPDLIYALTDDGLCKSTDRAKTWEFIADSDAKKLDIRSARHQSVRPIAIDPKNAEIVYAGSRTGKLFKSEDGGKTWKELTYRDALPKDPEAPAFLGKGSLRLNYESSAAGMDTMGRISKFYGPGKDARDWSAYKKFSARFRLPEGAPVLQASLVIQSGDNWLWQQGPFVDGKPGEWSEVSLDLSTLKGLNSVRMVHFVMRSPNAAWKGEVLLDAVALHTDAAGTLSAGQSPDGKTAVLVSDWEKQGDAEGWSANKEYKDSLHITAVRQSQEKKGGDVLSSVVVAPGKPSLLFASNNRHGIFRSEDAGATWTVLDAPKNAMNVTVSAQDPNLVWAACGANGLQMSTDCGRTWTAVLPDPAKKAKMHEVALHPARPGLVYTIASIDWGGTLYRSEDGGKTWTSCNKVRAGIPGNPTLPGDVDAQGLVGLSTVTNISVNPKNPDELFISGNWRNVFSTDGGRTLEERSTGADNTCTTDIQFLGGKTYATAMDEGLMVSDNNGGEWRQLIPMKYDVNMSGHFWRVRVAKVGESVRIITTASPWKSFGDPKCANRAYVSDDGGKTFTISQSGLPDYVPNVNCMWGRSFPRSLAMDPKNPDILYLGMDGDPEPAKKLPGGGIFRSADGGKTWTRCAGQPGGLRLYYGLVVDPTNSKRLYFSSCGNGGGAWKSEDEGATWEHVFKTEGWCFNLDIAPSGAVFVGGKELYRSVDQGKTWQKLTDLKGDPTIVGIAIDPANEQRIWISRTTWDGGAKGGIYRTTDGGKTWAEITGDIGYRKPQILRYNAETKELWAGGVGIFRLKQ